MNIQKANDVARMSHASQQVRPASQDTQKKTTTMAADNTDKFEPSESTYKTTYNRGANKAEHRSINDDDFRKNAGSSTRQIKNDAVRSMVQAQVNGQVNKGGYKPLFGGNETIMNALNAAEATSEKHTDYWGIEATAERIFTFAKNLAGDDDGMFQTLKDAFLKGFKQAEGARGGKLPDISYQTKSRVLEMFDNWEREMNAKKSEAKVEEKKEDEKKASGNTTHSGGKTIPFIGAAKYGSTGATAAPSTYSQGNTVPFIGDGKYGASFKEDFDVNGWKPKEEK